MNTRSARTTATSLCAVVALSLVGCGASTPGSGSPSSGSSVGATTTAITEPSPTTPITGPSSIVMLPPDPATFTDPATTEASVTTVPTVPTGPTGQTGPAPSSSSTDTVSPSTLPAETDDLPADVDVIGPYGWQDLELGMDPAAAAALGMFTGTPLPTADGVCEGWDAIGAAAIEATLVSATVGVAAIVPRSDAVIHTPEGMTYGWTVDQVATAYPDFDPADAHQENGVVIEAIGNSEGRYRLQFDDDDTLTYFVLELADQNCYS